MSDELERLRKENERLRELVYRDELTGLYNRRHFDELLDSELCRSQRYRHNLSLIVADVDLFKSINDNYGHPVGDKVIEGVANLLVQQARQCDTVARYGGDEFMLLLPETAVEGALAMAERLRMIVMGWSLVVEEERVPVTLSIGVSGWRPSLGAIDRETLIEQCDDAMYRAKRNGRNRAYAWMDG